MEKEFAEMLKGILENKLREEKSFEEKLAEWREEILRKPGGSDTVTMTRADFRVAMSRGVSEDSSAKDADDGSVKIGRLHVLAAMLGTENMKHLNSVYSMLSEEYVFGPVGGTSPYRTDPVPDNGADTPSEAPVEPDESAEK